MGEPGGDPDLTVEPVGMHRAGEIPGEDLDRHLQPMPHVVGEIHPAHAARAEQPHGEVSVAQVGKGFGIQAHGTYGVGPVYLCLITSVQGG